MDDNDEKKMGNIVSIEWPLEYVSQQAKVK